MFLSLPDDAKAFIEEIVEICKKHGFSLAHEDAHGGFIVDDYKEKNIRWLRGAGRRYSKDYEIWLGDTETYFNRGVAHFSDGTERNLSAELNEGSYGAGSVLIEEAPERDFGLYNLRWYLFYNCIEFYMWLEEVESITFHNESQHDIYLYRYAYLKAGETVKIVRGKKVHDEIFNGCSAVGMVYLTEAPGHPEWIGKPVFMVEGICKKAPELFYWRFISVDELQKGEDAAITFETAPGFRTFEQGKWHLKTDEGEYAYHWDPVKED